MVARKIGLFQTCRKHTAARCTNWKQNVPCTGAHVSIAMRQRKRLISGRESVSSAPSSAQSGTLQNSKERISSGAAVASSGGEARIRTCCAAAERSRSKLNHSRDNESSEICFHLHIQQGIAFVGFLLSKERMHQLCSTCGHLGEN